MSVNRAVWRSIKLKIVNWNRSKRQKKKFKMFYLFSQVSTFLSPALRKLPHLEIFSYTYLLLYLYLGNKAHHQCCNFTTYRTSSCKKYEENNGKSGPLWKSCSGMISFFGKKYIWRRHMSHFSVCAKFCLKYCTKNQAMAIFNEKLLCE